MSGFSVDWLSLREPVDHRSTNPAVRAAFVRDFGTRDMLRITDLGSGTGSHLRSLAPHLGMRQAWRLVDYDPRLLASARSILSAWAEEARDIDDRLLLRRGAQTIDVEFVEADLVGGLDALLDRPTDAVTSAALFDLVSGEFIQRLAAAMATAKLPLYAILSYDGHSKWSPPHEADADMLDAFHQHQGRDKGFGPAAGPRAADLLGAAFAQHGFAVTSGPSPWLLTQPHRQLIGDLAEGIAQAVTETGSVDVGRVSNWLDARREAKACEIGHRDIYARHVGE